MVWSCDGNKSPSLDVMIGISLKFVGMYLKITY